MTEKHLSLKSLEWYIFIGIMLVLFFSTQSYFGTANYGRIYKMNAFCVAGFLVFSLIINRGKLRFTGQEIFSYLIVLVPYVLLFAVSFILFFLSHRIEWSNLIYYNVTPILLCLMAISAYNSFGKKAITGVVAAAVANYVIYIITCVIKYGPLSLFEAGHGTEASSLLEVHELTFVFGIIIVYLIVSGFLKEKKSNKYLVILLSVFCLLGFKRILIAAMAVCVVMYFVLKRLKKPYVIIGLSIVMIVISLLWVYICSDLRLLTRLSGEYDINLMGRNWIYSNFYNYYEFSPSYVGGGVGYVQQLIGKMATMVFKDHTIGLHNDFLRLFIELGFFPYLGYFLLILPVSIKLIYNYSDSHTSLVYFVLWSVTLLCVATDNLFTYPNYMFTFLLLIIISINESRSRGTKRIRLKIKR